MKPEWFFHHEIPYEKMWPSDKYWMPIFLEGNKFKGRFHIVDKEIKDYEINKVDSLS